MISLENVSFAYADCTVLHNVTCLWPQGRITGLVGPNGSGKSTCLRLGAGLLAPQTGLVRLNGQDVKTYAPRAKARQTAFLPQKQAVSAMTVQTLVEQGRYPYTGFGHRLSQNDQQMVADALTMTGMTELAGRSLDTLSGGQVQKAYLAMVTAQQTEHILLDEPMTYLDISHQMEVMQLLRRLADAGRAVVVVLHDLGQAMELCDTLQVLHAGRLIYNGAPAELLASGALETAFGVRAQWREGLHFVR